MKKNHFKIIVPLVMLLGMLSCSQEETNTVQQVAARPTAPITATTIQIGTQKWMIRNLDVSRYSNGDPIPQVTDETQWANLTTGAWCYYNNESSNGKIYGKLYNWYAVNDPRGLAPTGYHVATDTEWSTLIDFLDPNTGVSPPNVAGNKMKSTTGWMPHSGITNNNSSGFTGLPGSYRSLNGAFNYIGFHGSWWCSSEAYSSNAWSRYLNSNYSYVPRTYNNKKSGFSVRCVKD